MLGRKFSSVLWNSCTKIIVLFQNSGKHQKVISKNQTKYFLKEYVHEQ